MKVIKYQNVTELNITFVRFEITRHKAYCRKKVLMKHKFYSNHGLIIIWDTVKTNHKPSHGSSFPAMKHANLLLREYSYGTPSDREQPLEDLLGLVGLRGLALQLVVCAEIEVCLVEL